MAASGAARAARPASFAKVMIEKRKMPPFRDRPRRPAAVGTFPKLCCPALGSRSPDQSLQGLVFDGFSVFCPRALPRPLSGERRMSDISVAGGALFALAVSALATAAPASNTGATPAGCSQRTLAARRAPSARRGHCDLAGWLPVALWSPPLPQTAPLPRGSFPGSRWRWSRCGTTCARWVSACASWSTASPHCGSHWRSRGRCRLPHRGPRPWLVVAVAGAIVAWSLNLYNFMDGNDGLAAAMAIVGFSAYGGGAHRDRRSRDRVFRAGGARQVPFFIVNRPPSRMIMGDVGAVPMGFLAAAFGLAQVAAGIWPAWFPSACLPALHRRRDADACASRVAGASGSGWPTGTITISGCTGWAPGIAERWPSMAPGWRAAVLQRSPACNGIPHWAGRRFSRGAPRARRFSRRLIIIGGARPGSLR